MSAQLSANLNAVAQLRNRRNLPWPSVVDMGRIAMLAGARGLTVHPRPDQRHIRFSDLPELRALLDNEFSTAEFNIEGYPTTEFIDLVSKHRPEQVTLVPDDPTQATSDHGWDFSKHGEMLSSVISDLKDEGFRIAIFIDPNPDDIPMALETGTDRVELYTGPYGACHDDIDKRRIELAKLIATGLAAEKAGLGVNAGHDLTVENLPALVREIPTLKEVSIGHGLTALALEHGMAGAVERFIKALQ